MNKAEIILSSVPNFMTNIDADLDQLIGLQRFTYAEASYLQQWIFRINVIVVLIGVTAIFVTNDFALITGAIIAFVLIAFVTYFDWVLNSHRTFAEKVRKATLLSRGLGRPLSAADRRSIRATFKGDDGRAVAFADPKYYASSAGPGPRRLAEMLEESAFWSEHLSKECARISWIRFVIFLVAAISIFVAVVTIFTQSNASGAAQVFLATLTLLISKNFLGAAISYTSTAASLRSILERLETSKKGDDSLEDLLFIFVEYNSAVEGAPLFIPGIYEKQQSKLNQLWRRHLID